MSTGKENFLVLEPHSYNSFLNGNATPTKAPGTTRVIDQLHSEIDELKQSYIQSQSKVKEYKQKYEVVTKRSTQVIESLSNAKHENDMMSSMLQRKERRIRDLEEQLTESMSRTDKMEFEQKAKDAKLQQLQSNENRLVSELEMSKISYDAIVRSQLEFKIHCEREISYIKDNYRKFLNERDLTLQKNVEKFTYNDGELKATFKRMTDRSEKLEELYREKNNAIVEALKLLASAAKDHGTKTVMVLNECEEVLKTANRKLPDFEKETVEETDLELSEPKTGELESVANWHSTPDPPMELTLPADFMSLDKIANNSNDTEQEEPIRNQRRNNRRSSYQQRKTSNNDKRKSRIASSASAQESSVSGLELLNDTDNSILANSTLDSEDQEADSKGKTQKIVGGKKRGQRKR